MGKKQKSDAAMGTYSLPGRHLAGGDPPTTMHAMKRVIDWGLPLLVVLALAYAFLPRDPQFARLPASGAPLSPWTYTNLHGQAVRSSDFTNQVMVINYWATWCPPCRAEIPHFNAFYEKYHRSGLEIIGIAVDQEGAAAVGPFVAHNDLKYPVVLYDFNPVALLGAQFPLPTTLIVNRSGKVVARYVGALSEKELEKTVAPLLADSVKPGP
jgi:thiol-disulfide isomerase/thioredoxin